MEPIVLLVDDDENLLRGLARVLHRQPFRLYTARSGEEAVAVVKAHPVDVLVTDQRMPGISGNDLLAWAAKQAPDVMRIVLTGHATTDAVIRAVNEGRVFQYLTKPCRELDLAIAIHKAIDYRNLYRENRRLTRQGRRWSEQCREVRERVDQTRGILAGPLRRRLAWLAGWHRAETPGDAVLSEADAYALLEEALELLDETECLAGELRPEPSRPPATLFTPALARRPVDDLTRSVRSPRILHAPREVPPVFAVHPTYAARRRRGASRPAGGPHAEREESTYSSRSA